MTAKRKRRRGKKYATHCQAYFTEPKNSRRRIGCSVCGWFLTSPDGKTFETDPGPPGRAPDFLIPIPVIGKAGSICRSGLVAHPFQPYRIVAYLFGTTRKGKIIDKKCVKLVKFNRVLTRVGRTQKFFESWKRA